MSISFFINNLHFALELMGAVVFLAAAWLMYDSHKTRNDVTVLLRAVGLTFCAIWQTIFAVGIGGDAFLYAGSALYILGLLLILGGFLKRQTLQVQSVVVLPAFAAWSALVNTIAGLALLLIAIFSYLRSRQEFNKTWIPFSLGFLFLGLAAVGGILAKGNDQSIPYIAQLLLEFIGFILIAKWAWQFLQLRIRESLMLIFISAALFLSTVVTLAFSTILVGQVTTQTQENLLNDAKVLSLNIDGLQQQSLAKTALIAQDSQLVAAVSKNDFTALGRIAESDMELYKLGFVTITDAQGTVLVRAHALSRRGDSLFSERSFEEAMHGNSFVTIEDSTVEKLSIRAGAPLVAGGKTIGVVVAGYPLDDALLDSIKRVTGLDMFIYEDTTSVAATALADDGRTRLTGLTLPAASISSVLTNGETVTARVVLGGKAFNASYLPLLNGDNKIIGMISAAKPEQDILDIENATNRLTLITVILIMLVLSYPMYLFTRRLTEEG